MSRTQHDGVSEQAKAAKHRLEDAQSLYSTKRWRGAMYLAGYAVECLLKTKLMRMFDCRRLRDLEPDLQQRGLLSTHATIFTHQLELLLRLTRSTDRLRTNQAHWQSFTLVNHWMPAWRYTADLSNAEDSKDFIEAVEELVHWIEYNV